MDVAALPGPLRLTNPEVDEQAIVRGLSLAVGVGCRTACRLRM